jgi:hypothetical protein
MSLDNLDAANRKILSRRRVSIWSRSTVLCFYGSGKWGVGSGKIADYPLPTPH